MRVVILAGGPIENYHQVPLYAGDMLICADSGARHAKALGVLPDLIIGDMDSVDPGLLAELEAEGCTVRRFPKEKNEVDTELALEAALSFNPEKVFIYGGTGGRLDHTLANIHLLALPAQRGIRAFLEDHRNRITVVTPELGIRIHGREKAFSLLPLTSAVEGVAVRGAVWELDEAKFDIGKPYGISNRVRDESACISITRGLLLVIEQLAER